MSGDLGVVLEADSDSRPDRRREPRQPPRPQRAADNTTLGEPQSSPLPDLEVRRRNRQPGLTPISSAADRASPGEVRTSTVTTNIDGQVGEAQKEGHQSPAPAPEGSDSPQTTAAEVDPETQWARSRPPTGSPRTAPTRGSSWRSTNGVRPFAASSPPTPDWEPLPRTATEARHRASRSPSAAEPPRAHATTRTAIPTASQNSGGLKVK